MMVLNAVRSGTILERRGRRLLVAVSRAVSLLCFGQELDNLSFLNYPRFRFAIKIAHARSTAPVWWWDMFLLTYSYVTLLCNVLKPTLTPESIERHLIRGCSR